MRRHLVSLSPSWEREGPAQREDEGAVVPCDADWRVLSRVAPPRVPLTQLRLSVIFDPAKASQPSPTGGEGFLGGESASACAPVRNPQR